MLFITLTVNCDLLLLIITWERDKFLKNFPKYRYEQDYERHKAIPIT